MTRFEEYCARGVQRHGDRFKVPTGAAFIDAFNKGPEYRVKVRTVFASGDVHERWGYVSATTGWAPAFLLMHRRGAHGSSDLLYDGRDEIIDAKWLRRAA